MLTPEQATQAAAAALENRTQAVANLAQALIEHQHTVTAAREELKEVQTRTAATIKTADKHARDAWNQALKAGWTPTELTRIGLKQPTKTPTHRQKPRHVKKHDTFKGEAPDNLTNNNTHHHTEGQQP